MWNRSQCWPISIVTASNSWLQCCVYSLVWMQINSGWVSRLAPVILILLFPCSQTICLTSIRYVNPNQWQWYSILLTGPINRLHCLYHTVMYMYTIACKQWIRYGVVSGLGVAGTFTCTHRDEIYIKIITPDHPRIFRSL